MEKVTDRADKASRTRKRRKPGFVMVDQKAAQLLRHWIDIAPVAKAKRQGARLLLLDLLVRADWRDASEGFVRGSITGLARETGLSPNTFREYLAVLSTLGLVERGEVATNREDRDQAEVHVPLDVLTWLQHGDPLPEVMWLLPAAIGALLSGDPRDERQIRRHGLEDRGRQLLAAACSVRDHVRPADEEPLAQSVSGTSSDPERVPAQSVSGTCAGPERVKAASPGGTAASDSRPVTDSRQAPATDVDQMLVALSSCCDERVDSKTVRQEIDSRLTAGWRPDEIKRLIQQKAARARARGNSVGGGLVVTWLRELPQVPERVEEEQQRQRAADVAEAPECGHGTPNGTAKTIEGLPRCPLCRNGVEETA